MKTQIISVLLLVPSALAISLALLSGAEREPVVEEAEEPKKIMVRAHERILTK